MPTTLHATGISGHQLWSILRQHLKSDDIEALGFAVAYVSVYGASQLDSFLRTAGVHTTIRMVVDIGDAITHPRALELGLEANWKIRAVNPAAGTFHPKLIIGGRAFAETDLLRAPRLLIVGSANLTKGGLINNVECSLLRTSDQDINGVATVFRRLWRQGTVLDEPLLREYEAYFAEQNRTRAPKDMEILGVADEAATDLATADLRGVRAPTSTQRSMPTSVARAAWAGLESFTGEFRFQIEFPRDAGEVLRRMLGPGGGDTNVLMLCEDGQQRAMRFRYYEDNAMFRLNVPNDTPGVDQARLHKSGIAIVEAGRPDQMPTFRVIHSAQEMATIRGRSVALGTWGRTSTRFYGWF